MLLTIDVGNTDTKLGFFARTGGGVAHKLMRDWRVTTARRRTADEFGVLFSALFRRAEIPLDEVRAIVVSSVVPQTDRALIDACKQYFDVEPHLFTAATQTLIAIETERPKEVGADLAAAAIGGRDRYGAPLIVIGFGTATTFSAISRAGVYLGVAIAPGIQISIDALVARTAKLPQVALDPPDAPYGRDTISALQAGIVYGFVGQSEGLIARLRARLGDDARVVATGGFAEVIARHTAAIDSVDPHLILHGLRVFYERNVVAAGATAAT
ncbi:MAG: type III pantothenate kinase [Vulcanimicrobiaceae bacterium]